MKAGVDLNIIYWVYF